MIHYNQIIIVGSSQLAENCRKLSILLYPTIEVLMYNTQDISKNVIMEELARIREPALIFSIINRFLFPENVVKNPYLKLVNLHHALLPKHPGRNAEAWAIFDGDLIAGITWHIITEKIDAGNIILQEKTKINETMTSLQLFRKMNDLALKSFPHILDVCICENAKGYVQPTDCTSKIHLAKEKPGNGYLNIDWDIDTIYRFLRSMDYGILNTLGIPKIKIEDCIYTWKKYTYSSSDESNGITVNNDSIIITKNKKEIKLLKTQKIEGEK